MKQSSPFRQSLSTLHLFLSAIIFSLIVEPAVFLSYFHDEWVYSLFGRLLWLSLVPIKVYVDAGLLGCFVALAADPRLCLDREIFQQKADKFWLAYLFVSLIPIAVHFLICSVTPGPYPAVETVFAFLSPLTLYLMAVYVLKNERGGLSGKGQGRTLVSRKEQLQLLALYVLGIVVFVVSKRVLVVAIGMERIGLFVYKYVYFLTFIFILTLKLRAQESVCESEDSTKELFLINPVAGGCFFRWFLRFVRSRCAVFLLIRALTPKNYRVREFNQVVWREQYYASGKLVAITCFTCNCAVAYKIAKEFKRRGSTVVMGGPHVMAVPEEALEFCDSVVIGDVEPVWEKVVTDYEQGCLQQRYEVKGAAPFSQKAFVEILKMPSTAVKDYIQMVKGCKFKCHFCMIHELSHGQLVMRPIEQVVQLLERVKEGYRDVLFIDNNVYADPRYAKELFNAIKPLGIRWYGSSSIDIAADKETLRLARESGCQMLLIGFEIAGDSKVAKKGGKFALSSKYLQYARRIKRHGIKIKAQYIYGFEEESFKDLIKLWWFCIRVWPMLTVLSVLTPYPGTSFYADLMKEDRILNLNWRAYSIQKLVFDHPRFPNVITNKVNPFVFLALLTTTSWGGLMVLVAAVISIRMFGP